MRYLFALALAVLMLAPGCAGKQKKDEPAPDTATEAPAEAAPAPAEAAPAPL